MNGQTGAAVRLTTPEQISARAGQCQVPELRLPDPHSEFARRSARLLTLSDGHAMRDYLVFVGAVADAQQRAVEQLPELPLPRRTELLANQERFGAPLPAAGERSPLWLDGLRMMLVMLQGRSDGAAGEAVRRLAAAPDGECEAQADRLLHGVSVGLDLAAAPLLAAALQVHWVRWVDAVRRHAGASVFDRPVATGVCPCCGFRPTTSVVRIGGEEGGYRYLHCALCAAEWHLVRIRCAHCLGTKGIHYLGLEAADRRPPNAQRRAPAAVVRVECCDECGHYMKILSMERDPDVVPAADDLATVALDLLVADTGRTCAGVNLMLLYGDPGDG